ncbi:general secretion pathway protein D [Methylomicrobium album BG8]|uniref:General secretion pathway protein D n=2 Tax=Methylomicrobium album TaxID=39775 RepID=H8GIF8_METAL|nr:general secretion pathway protein D [Methylomicrobium album BG8]
MNPRMAKMKNNLNTLRTASYFVAAGLTLSGCELMGPKPPEKLKLTPISPGLMNEKPGVVFEGLQNKQPSEDALRSKIELYPASGRPSPKRPGGARSGAGAGQPQAKTAGPGTYSLNFDEADLGEVSKVILSDILGQNYILSPKVAGKVTLQTTEPLSKEELLPALEMVLRENNAALVKEGRIYRIEPASDAVFSSNVGQSGRGKAGFQSQVIPIRYVAAADLFEVIKPLLNEKSGINVDAGKNTLIVSGSAAEIDRVMDMVATFDIDILRGRSFGLFPLAHVSPEDVIKELEAVFNLKEGEEKNTFFRFLPIERLNAVLAITQQQDYLRDIESWVFRLDRATSANGGGVNVYKVQHMDAVELADILNAIFTGASMPSKQAKVAPGQTAATITNKNTDKSASARRERTASTGKTGEASVSNVGENVRIIADESNNSIVTVSTPQEYEVIHKVITQLDAMPLQVLIDATIVSVTLTDNLKYGIQWYLGHANGQSIATRGSGAAASQADENGNPTGADLAAIAAAAVTGGFGYSFISHSGDIRAILSAEANDNKLNVISSPSIMVLNNHEASIQVGDEIPLRTSQSTSVTNVNTGVVDSNQTTGGLITSGIQQRKTGVKLKVKPRVNANGFVIMDIEQTVETPKTTTVSEIDSPTIQTREITSNVAVQSGETIVLGGLIDENDTNNLGGIPFLHKLPLIGPLFGTTSKEKLKTELVVLITPRVVSTKLDASLIANEFKRKLTGLYEDPPVQDRSVRPD